MSEANKDESDRCKTIAEAALRQGDPEKATRFLQKAKRMSPGDSSIDALLAKVASGDYATAAPPAGSSTSGASRPAGAEGTRQRPAASTSTGSRDNQARINKEGKPYTPDQAKEVQKILRTKDYYEILGISKDASEDQIKKAYKKLALKLHPDKNTAPGAEEAFKKVSRAVQCLTDEEKKNVYDRYGDEERVPQRQRHQYQQDFMTPEDLFNAFFGGGAFHTQTHQQNNNQQGDPQAQRAHIFQMLPVLLLVMLTLASNFAGRDSGSRFSFTLNGQYQTERSTATLNVPYFVTNDFEDHYGEGTRALADFEKQVDVYYVRNLHSECDYQEKVMYKKVMLAKRRNSQEELEKARNHPRPACKEIDKVKKRHLHTYRSAMHQ